MERINLTHAYLETLSSSDLIELADDYGIDMPENLSRRFIIAELLETAEEYLEHKKPDLIDNALKNEVVELSASYNENKITAVLHNPAWCYVYWDFNDNDFNKAVKLSSFLGFLLRVSCFDSLKAEIPFDYYDIPVDNADRDQFVLLSVPARALNVDLIAQFKTRQPVCMARSELLPLPWGHPKIGSAWLRKDFSSVQILSGLPDLLRSQYMEHRQSFSLDV